MATTRGSTFHTTVAAYRGRSLETLRFIVCADGTEVTEQARLRISLVARKRYWFQVGGYGSDGEI